MRVEETLISNQTVLQRISAAIGVTAVAAVSIAVWYFNPSNVNFFPICPLYALTGLACPGCGLTRGFHALFHGDVLTALGYNALLPVFAFIFGYFLLAMILFAVRGRGLSFKIFRPRLLYGFLILSLVFAVVRNLPIYPFSVLYP